MGSDESEDSEERLYQKGLLLLEEGSRLGTELEQVLAHIPPLWSDVEVLLETAQTSSRHRRTFEILSDIRTSHKKTTSNINDLPNISNSIFKRIRALDFVERIKQLGTLVLEVDPRKIADPELLSLIQEAKDNVFRHPPRMFTQFASVQAPVFVCGLAHHDVLSAFLGRPTKFSALVSGAIKILKAAAEDVAGSFIPVLSTARALAELSKSRIEGEIENLKRTVSDMDRIFKLDTSLGHLLELSGSVRHLG
jgi:hypothetical protein